MDTPATAVRPCQLLRTKNPHGLSPQDHANWIPGVAAASPYWCLHTMSVAGPDEGYVHLARCVPGRACYQPPEE
jgi:hypothetical protein